MIYGLSHIIYATNNFQKRKLPILKKYKIIFIKKRLINNKEKFIFMRPHQKLHNIYFLKKKNNYNIEVVEYKKTLKKNNIFSLSKKNINLQIPNPEEEKLFFKSFCKVNNNCIIKNNAISKSLNFSIKLKKDKTSDNRYLNSEGINSVVFFCNNIKILREKFIKLKLKCTKIFLFKLLNKSYKIIIVKSKNNIFYEFLELI
jgi:hypothetical protein